MQHIEKPEANDFSIVLGGPFFQLLRKAHLYPLLVFRLGSPTTIGIQFVVGGLMQVLKIELS